MKRSVLALLAVFAGVAVPHPAVRAQTESQAAKQLELNKLKIQIQLLQRQLAELGGPYAERPTQSLVDLGRTSLASIDSSLDGALHAADLETGVLNAFDDDDRGDQWSRPNGRTTWYSRNGTEWVDVIFAVPVFVSTISVDSSQTGVSAQVFPVAGEPQTYGASYDASEPKEIALPLPLAPVTKVHLTFHPYYTPSVHEIRVMGYVPPGVHYTVGTPRLAMNRPNANNLAQAFYQEWQTRLTAQNDRPDVQETPESFIITYHHDTTPRRILPSPDTTRNPPIPPYDLLRVTVNKKTGKVTSEPLFQLVPRK